MRSKQYQVTWHWRDESPSGVLKLDFVQAVDAQGALRKVKSALRAEYTDVTRRFVAVEVVLIGG